MVDMAVDLGTVLEYMEYLEDYRGGDRESKGRHWDSLKESLASGLGAKEPRIMTFKYNRPKEGPVDPGADASAEAGVDPVGPALPDDDLDLGVGDGEVVDDLDAELDEARPRRGKKR